MTAIVAKITPQGVLVPRPLLTDWGDGQEVEIERRARSVVIKPRSHRGRSTHARIVDEMRAAGLVESVPWTPPPAVSAQERARLAAKLGQGQPLSAVILADRAERA